MLQIKPTEEQQKMIQLVQQELKEEKNLTLQDDELDFEIKTIPDIKTRTKQDCVETIKNLCCYLEIDATKFIDQKKKKQELMEIINNLLAQCYTKIIFDIINDINKFCNYIENKFRKLKQHSQRIDNIIEQIDKKFKELEKILY